jgi:hypothetical protein
MLQLSLERLQRSIELTEVRSGSAGEAVPALKGQVGEPPQGRFRAC